MRWPGPGEPADGARRCSAAPNAAESRARAPHLLQLVPPTLHAPFDRVDPTARTHDPAPVASDAVSTVYPSTIAAPVEHEIVITKSRFITTVAPVADVADADRVIAGVRKRFWDARHNCTAMVTGVLGDQARSSDDGEPSGTAGVPMLEVLRRRGLTDVVAVVTRYFGGVKLGAGGLVRAYSTSVSETLDRAVLVQRRALTRIGVDVPHAEAGRIDNVLRDWVRHHDAVLGDTGYGSVATFELWVPQELIGALRADLASMSGGALEPLVGAERVVDVPTG
ncbi:DUF1949 domain-containing protein [Curtobacterium luteum]|nr:DUF1949 domain-containing protein [Curtobacterium luteum]